LGQVNNPPAQGVHTIHLCTLSKIHFTAELSARGHFVPVSRSLYIVFSVRQQLGGEIFLQERDANPSKQSGSSKGRES
ncbi:MAG TPA: hypothetical protein VJR95_01140, partial [Rhodanobacter sp.]|nr:hypothetical protein [Rhodanobacter sp.]